MAQLPHCDLDGGGPKAPLGSRLAERFSAFGLEEDIPELRGQSPRPAAGLCAALLAVLWALPVGAVEMRLAAAWSKTVESASAQLKNGRYEEALPALKRLTTQMCDVLGPGDAAAQVFGVVIVLRAIAEAGLGNRDDALWYWYTAQGLYPTIVKSDLTRFGEPGEFLKAHKKPGLDLPWNLAGEVTPPRARKSPKPKFPRGARAFRVEGPLIVEVIIGKDGIVRWPRVLQPLPAPTLSYVALEAVHRWRFEPAKLGGRPIDVYFNLTVNYDLR